MKDLTALMITQLFFILIGNINNTSFLLTYLPTIIYGILIILTFIISIIILMIKKNKKEVK